MIQIEKAAPDFEFIILQNSNENYAYRKIKFIKDRVPPLKSVGGINTILEMNSLISDTLDIIAPLSQITTHGSISDTNVWPIYNPSGIFFSPNFPDFLIPEQIPNYISSPQVIPNAITWEVVRQEPGSVSTTPFKGTQEITPRSREMIALFGEQESRHVSYIEKTPIMNNTAVLSYLDIKGQFFDNLVQYNIWSKSNFEVEMLTEWFIDFMRQYTGMLREAGVVNLWFDRRIRDDIKQQMKNGYHVRSVLYYIRTERIYINSVEPIKRINLRINVDTLKSTIETLNNHLNEENLNRSLMNKWIKINQLGG